MPPIEEHCLLLQEMYRSSKKHVGKQTYESTMKMLKRTAGKIAHLEAFDGWISAESLRG